MVSIEVESAGIKKMSKEDLEPKKWVRAITEE